MPTPATAPQVPAEMQALFTGDLLEPGDDGYEEARRVHNGLVDKQPGLIARCRTTADVVDAVRLGREHGWEIAVRGGGHNVAGKGTTEGGLMIDLAPMKGVRVDGRAWKVWAQPGLTWREYNRAAALHGLATTGGVVSTTGIAGLTLGGGEGWLMGRHGLTVDHLLGAEVVTADGELLAVGPEEHADLFWALRGGGGNFGVVTAFEYRAHPVETVVGGMVAHPLADVRGVFDFYRDYAEDAPDDLTAFFAFVHGPEGLGQKLVVVPLCHSGGDHARVDADLGPLRRFGRPVLDDLRRMPYPVVNTLIDDGYPRGALNYWKSAFLRAPSDEAMEIMTEALERCPSPMGGLLLARYHGAVTRVPVDATAFPHRSAGYSLVVAAQWADPADTDVNVAWARETFAALSPHLVEGCYVNNLSADDTAAVRRAYGPNYDRLATVKRRYDPDNVFRLNHNIHPSGP